MNSRSCVGNGIPHSKEFPYSSVLSPSPIALQRMATAARVPTGEVATWTNERVSPCALPELNSRNSSLGNPTADDRSQLDSFISAAAAAATTQGGQGWADATAASAAALGLIHPRNPLPRNFPVASVSPPVQWVGSFVSRTALSLLTFGLNSNLFAAFSLHSQVHK